MKLELQMNRKFFTLWNNGKCIYTSMYKGVIEFFLTFYSAAPLIAQGVAQG